MSQQLSLAYDRRQIILERSEVADKLAGQYVEVYDFSVQACVRRSPEHSLGNQDAPAFVDVSHGKRLTA